MRLYLTSYLVHNLVHTWFNFRCRDRIKGLPLHLRPDVSIPLNSTYVSHCPAPMPCAIPPKVAISARALCFGHSETSHARTVGSPMCSRQSTILASMRSLALHKPKRGERENDCGPCRLFSWLAHLACFPTEPQEAGPQRSSCD